jgi:hypothetical protein
MATKSAPKNKSLAAAPTKQAMAVEPNLHQVSHETQKYGEIIRMPNGLSEAVCKKSVALLNQCLADTITLRDMYKKHHWQVVGPTFNQLHLMYDQHYEGQVLLVEVLIEKEMELVEGGAGYLPVMLLVHVAQDDGVSQELVEFLAHLRTNFGVEGVR